MTIYNYNKQSNEIREKAGMEKPCRDEYNFRSLYMADLIKYQKHIKSLHKYQCIGQGWKEGVDIPETDIELVDFTGYNVPVKSFAARLKQQPQEQEGQQDEDWATVISGARMYEGGYFGLYKLIDHFKSLYLITRK